MHPDATDSSGAGLSAAPAVGAPGERRPEPREDAAAPRGPGGRSWRVPVAVASLAAVSLSYLGPGCWQGAGGARPCTVLFRLSLYLVCAAAAFLLGTLFSLVCRSRRTPPPDFAAAWRRLAARRGPGVSTGLPRSRPASPGPPRFRCPVPAARSEPRGSRRARPLRPGPRRGAGSRSPPCGPGLRGPAGLRGTRSGSRSQPPSVPAVLAEEPSRFLAAALQLGSGRKPSAAFPAQALRPGVVVVVASANRNFGTSRSARGGQLGLGRSPSPSHRAVCPLYHDTLSPPC